MPLELIRNDMTNDSADIIVNTANPRVAVGRGVDEAIYKAAGRDALFAERKKIGDMVPGEIAVTPAFGLKAKHIIHAVGPAWEGGERGEPEAVASCYSRSLDKAKELGAESIAFPLLASGTYGFPKKVALRIAISEIRSFLSGNDMTVYLVVYDKESFQVSGMVFDKIKAFIDDYDVEPQKLFRSYGRPHLNIAYTEADIDEDTGADTWADIGADTWTDAGTVGFRDEPLDESLDEKLEHMSETFQEHLFRLIDRKGLDDREVYKRANIDRKHFSKIRSNVSYNPSKRTALALAIALELNLDETTDLLLRAGIALSPSNPFDVIMTYCIENEITDVYEINCILFNYDQPTLGA
ncbi:MAG: macro domain-containing protein [Firmicutes bacterium]|nr:macro domain-containing protein [Bacillota bacterium]